LFDTFRATPTDAYAIMLKPQRIRPIVQLRVPLRFIPTRNGGSIMRSFNNLVKLVLWPLSVMLNFLEAEDKAS
jgi:hypothetical protein